ncbi:MAG: RNA-binding protein [Alphaproteobacteria bacterium]|nr:RNA-binding protein [Alphaproteobacteria bacterium]
MNKKLYVSNLAFSINDESLGGVFAEIGSVVSARVISDRYSGRSKGFGFVEMATDADAQEAIKKLNGVEIEGRTINVAEARPQEDRPQGGDRGGYAPRGDGDRGGFGSPRGDSGGFGASRGGGGGDRGGFGAPRGGGGGDRGGFSSPRGGNGGGGRGRSY